MVVLVMVYNCAPLRIRLQGVRSRIALGKEIGKHGPLPRGYGIMKLFWDEELASFAQVLANQCVLTRDLCRASKNFHDPSQATGLVRFTFPDWLPVSNKSHFTTSNLTASKLNYAITQTMKTWYSQKNYVTPEMVLRYPDFQNSLMSQYGKLYLKMIHGSATHMGCGISAYTQFAFHDNNSPLNYNVVCNYSSKPRVGEEVYTTTPPTEIGYTVKCGCPEDYEEEADCLCYPNLHHMVDIETVECSNDNCKQSVVLLPIFTVEDAPPSKLQATRNKTRRLGASRVHNQVTNYNQNTQRLEPQSLNEFTNLLKGSNVKRPRYQSKPSEVQRQFESQKQTNKPHRYMEPNFPGSHVSQKQAAKNSIFSRAEKFQLPMKKALVSYQGKELKKDVIPRKDFSSVQKLLKSYLNKKRNHAGSIINGETYEYTSNEPLKWYEIDEHISANNLVKKTEVVKPDNFVQTYPKLDLFYDNLNTTKNIKEYDVTHTTDNSDKKLMRLLDNLEKEVKHINLDSTDKEIFDSKIRKIYGRVVGKHRDLKVEPNPPIENYQRHDKEVNQNLINYEIAADNEFINTRTLQKHTPEANKLNIYDDTGVIKRDQNSIRSGGNNYRSDYADYKHSGINNNDFRTKMDMNDDDRISFVRRKYYQDKLDNLQRKLQNVRINHERNVNSPRHVLPVRPTKVNEMQMRPSKDKQMDTFYIPDRARFIHGF